MNLTSTQKAPDANLVIPHFMTGGISLVIVTFLLLLFPSALLQHYFNPIILAATHLLVLGFITMICFGALYQLLPVILDVKLYSEKIGFLTFFFLLLGVLLLVVAFWLLQFDTLFYIAGTCISLSVFLFLFNVVLTIKQDTKYSIEKNFVLAASVWLFITILLGFTFGLNLKFSFFKISHLELLKLHAHIGIFGWFTQLIIGIGSKLFPMFLLSYEASRKPLKIAFYTINLGLLLGLLAATLTFKWGINLAVILVLVAIGCFLYFIFKTYTKRVKKSIDYGMKKAVLAVSFLLIPFLLISGFYLFNAKGFSISFSLVYGFMLLVGFISMLVMGLTYKTLPFIIWLKLYKEFVGKNKIPMPKDLYSERLQIIQFVLFVSGFLTIVFGIISTSKISIQIGTIFLFIASICYLINLLKIIFHKRQLL